MEYANLPGTGIKLSRVCLGTMMFGEQTPEAESLSILDYVFDQGLNFWDTANCYTNGESERIVGKAMKGRREDVFLATKVCAIYTDKMNYSGLNRRAIKIAIESSLKRLDTDYVDLYYLHHPDHETPIEETMETMNDLVHSGKVHYIGVSNYASWQVADILAYCDKYGFVKPVISQNIYNLLLRDVEKELIPCLNAHDMCMAVYNPIAGGLLTGKYKNHELVPNARLANKKNYYERYWTEENLSLVDQFTAIAEKNRLNVLQLALYWVYSQSSVKFIINGVSKLEQIKQNIETMKDTSLDPAVVKACDETWENVVGKRFAYNR
jgi:aryl-alcohol dehydrogenase-like predicted oxidoreductase